MIMAALQKMLLLATQCAVISSPVIKIRRRRTLRMLLSRVGSSGRRLHRSEKRPQVRRKGSGDKGSDLMVRQKLRDLFVSSPPSLDERLSDNAREGVLPANGFADGGGGGGGLKRSGDQSLRPASAKFRQRLIRRAWRPVLVTIPE